MTALTLYFLFCVSVGLWACYELMAPALRLIVDRENDVMYQNKLVAYVTLFCMSCLVAPLVVVIIMVPNLNAITVAALAYNRD